MMRKLTLAALAASVTFLPGTALAQPGGHQGPGNVQVRHQGQGQVRMPHHRPGMVRGPHHGRRFSHIGRINRGGVVPHFWFGPQFVVRNWGMYGFPQPMHDRRWVRYYDDALLIDRSGRVHDGRYGMEWDRYEDRWDYDDRGIPVYAGDDDYEDDYDDDYERADRGDYDRGHHGGGYEYREDRSARDCRCGPSGYGPSGASGYGHGYGYGYGYGYGLVPMIVTETTTTTTSAPVVETRTYYEYVEEEVRAAPRRKARRPVRRAPRPAPLPGERG